MVYLLRLCLPQPARTAVVAYELKVGSRKVNFYGKSSALALFLPHSWLIPRSSGDGDGIKSEEDEETPHARGPEEIGMEDTGPQAAGSMGVAMQGIDVEAAVGRRADEAMEESSAYDTEKRSR